MTRLQDCGIEPQMHVLNNEALDKFWDEIKRNKVRYRKIPLHMHRGNATEKAIQTFKDHFTAILAIVDKIFPMHLWDTSYLKPK